ncbi:hypothetical protein [Haliangium sp.]|uniref:hypothetical protein n=1 Tax=Haliangium sp. TaxID=2663208 RepID=UPI003D0A3D90
MRTNWNIWHYLGPTALPVLLLATLTPAVLVTPVPGDDAVAWAQDDDDDDDWDDEDEDEDDEDEEEEEEDGEPQPPVTAGGLFTKKTYPVAELERPLTVIKGMFEARGGIQIDVSNETAFERFRFQADARYGLQDHVELQAEMDFLLGGDRLVGDPVALVGLGFEGGLIYDMVHFRSLGRLAINPVAGTDGLASDETDTQFDLVLGLPFRYKVMPKLAIVALDELMAIHLTGGKPDLTVGVGGIFQALDKVALFARAEIFIPEFNTDGIQAPITLAAQFSPTNKIDLGLEFFLPINLANADQQNMDVSLDRFANRFLFLFVQARL